ncbi:zinc finger protein OZF-like [Nothobranchius furzeri]|uniref:C2H2-type domain-containing protein n=1 Tax=Nothobranchius furzeri TaxID=105023 RepID=A0A8C6KCH5_NOTFU
MDQQDPGHLHIKEEQEEIWTSLEGEQLHLKEETDVARFPLTIVSIKIEDNEKKPLLSHLHQHQIEDRDVPTSSSADQMITETGGEAETSRSSYLNPHEKTSDSSETEVSGDDDDDDVNLDSELSDSGPETGEEDIYWNESRFSPSDVKTVNKSFICSECGEQFLHKRSLKKHARVTSHSANSSSGSFKEKCVRVNQNVNSCREVQTEQKLFSCDFCGKVFSQKSTLTNHIRVHTGEKPFACELCGQRFSRKTNLNRHTRGHTGQKPFSCEICAQRFTQKAHLNSHIGLHAGHKPFACEFCGQRFSRKTTLSKHIRVHTGQKPFACEFCEQKFSQKTHLNTHMRVHTGQKPFACEFCGQKFSQKTSLNNHMRVHTGQKPFACEFCEQRFSQKANLNRHRRVHIGLQEEISLHENHNEPL